MKLHDIIIFYNYCHHQSLRATITGSFGSNLSLPFKSFNSITKTYPTVLPYALLINSFAATAVPPVAKHL